MIYASFIFASWIILETESFHFDQWLWLKILLVTFVCQTCLYYNDLYDLKITDSLIELGIRLLQALGAAAIFLAGIFIIFPGTIIGQGIFVVSIGFIILLIVSWRLCYMQVLSHGMFDQKIILLGSGDLAQNIINEINDKKDCGYSVTVNVRGCSDNTDFTIDKNISATIYKKDYNGLCEMAKELSISKIVVALTDRRGTFPSRELLKCRVDGIDILEGTSFY